mmetsp:Transcript_104839/g.296266  ORF Transcript_104839/g.296266 Transcript_104839/m.296266 type:complete len:228 (-) Transcript_104839:542-1225(-)
MSTAPSLLNSLIMFPRLPWMPFTEIILSPAHSALSWWRKFHCASLPLLTRVILRVPESGTTSTPSLAAPTDSSTFMENSIEPLGGGSPLLLAAPVGSPVPGGPLPAEAGMAAPAAACSNVSRSARARPSTWSSTPASSASQMACWTWARSFVARAARTRSVLICFMSIPFAFLSGSACASTPPISASVMASRSCWGSPALMATRRAPRAMTAVSPRVWVPEKRSECR